MRRAGRGRIYGAMVGVNTYRCPQIRPLKYAAADAVAVRDALACRLGLDDDRTVLLAGDSEGGEQPTKSAILTALASFTTPNVRYEDTFVFFFSGRAFEVSGKTYLAASDAQIGSDLLMRETTISLTSLHGFLEGVPAGQQILIFEASRESPVWTARESVERPTSRDTAILAELKQVMHAPQSRAVIWSGWHGQEAHEYADRGHGWYCWNLLLELNDVGEKGTSIGDLHARVKDRMAESAETLLPVAADQEPRIRIVGDVPVLRPAPCEPAPAPSEPAPEEGSEPKVQVADVVVSDAAETQRLRGPLPLGAGDDPGEATAVKPAPAPSDGVATEPSKPAASSEPAKPTEQSEPSAPAEPAGPTESAEPVASAEPTESADAVVDDPFNPRDKDGMLRPRTFTCKSQATIYAVLPNGEPDVAGRLPGTVRIPKCRTWRVISGGDIEGVLAACIDDHAAGLQIDRRATDGDIVEMTEAMPWLQEVSLAGCESLTERGVGQMSKLRRLRYLDLSRCGGVTDAGLDALTGLSHLQELSLSDCSQITQIGLTHIARLERLQTLVLSGCSGITDDSLLFISRLPQLRWLSLAGCVRIGDEGMQHLGTLAELATLELSRLSRLTGSGLGALKKLPHLERLWLEGCDRVTDDGIMEVATLAQLAYVNIKGCSRVTNAGLATLGRLPKLKMVYLTLGGGIDAEGVKRLGDLKPTCVIDGIEAAGID